MSRIYALGVLICVGVIACSGQDPQQPPAPVGQTPPAPPPAVVLLNVDVLNAATGFVIASGVVGNAVLDSYESTIRVVVNAPSDVSEVRFHLSDVSGSHCPGIDQVDTTDPFEFTIDAPSAGGECVYVMRGVRSGSASTLVETLTVHFAANDASSGGGGGSTSPARYDFTYGATGSSPYQIGAVTTRDGHGNRIYCVISHFSYDDPIVFPGEAGRAHLHMFWGNTSTDAHTTAQSILTTGAGSCEGGTDYRVGAWIPAVFNAHDEVVVPEEVFIYYKTFGGPGMRYDLVQQIPLGLGMLASSDTLNFDGSLIDAGFAGHNGQNAFSMNITFPSCVATENGQRDGQPILSFRDMPGEAASRVNSHVAYPSGGNEVDCPLSHPYRFPTPQFIMFFDASVTGDAPYLSSDAMAGAAPLSTLHGDYMFGSDPDVNLSILRCVQESRSCGFEGGRGQLPDRFFGPAGQVYLSSVNLADGTDRTPFGNTLQPVLPGSGSTKPGGHVHGATPMSKSGHSFSAYDLAADLFTLRDGQWVGNVVDGATLYAAPDEQVIVELKFPEHVSRNVGSIEIKVNDKSHAVVNDARSHSVSHEEERHETGVVLLRGENTIRVRLYEQPNLGGSFLGESKLTFRVHGS